jgi:radical SAM superfamily enzyme YgiQ (UPF0313 family)
LTQVVIFTGYNYPNSERVSIVNKTLGAFRAASALIQAGYTVKVIDHFYHLTVDEMVSAVRPHIGADTLWLGYSSTFLIGKEHDAKMVQLYLRVKNLTNAKIVYGGASVDEKDFDPRVDYYVSGYSDNSIVALTDYIAGKSDQLITKKINGSTLVDSKDYPEPTMDSLKTEWSKFDILPNEPLPLEFARGCIFKCKFCNYPLIGKRKGTYIRDMGQVREELIELWETKQVDTFYITDDTFNDDNDKMESFHKLFTSLPYKPKFSAFLRLDLIDRFPHQADLLLDAGIVGSFFGIETFNLKNARVIGKGLHPDRIKKRLSWVRDKWKGKANIGVGLILGLPYDDEVYYKELEEYIRSPDYPIDQTSFNPLYIKNPNDGTRYMSEFSINSEVYGYKFDEDGNWYNENGMTRAQAEKVAQYFSSIVPQKPADFQVITLLGLGIKLDDILKMTYNQLYAKYDLVALNNKRLTAYKNMIGVK